MDKPEIVACPVCGCIHRPKFPDNPTATALAEDGPGLTWEHFDEANADTKAYQVACTSCDLEGPHTDTRKGAIERWNLNAARILEATNKARLDELAHVRQAVAA